MSWECVNNESDEPFTITYAVIDHDSVRNESRQGTEEIPFAQVGSFLTMPFESGSSAVINPATGQSGYLQGDTRTMSEAEIAAKVEYGYNTCSNFAGLDAAVSLRQETVAMARPSELILVEPFTFTRGTRREIDGYYMELQDDGNFVVKMTDGTFVNGFNQIMGADKFSRIAEVRFQDDGNFAAYDADGGYIWSALHVANPGGKLRLYYNGFLTLQDAQGTTQWDFKREY